MGRREYVEKVGKKGQIMEVMMVISESGFRGELRVLGSNIKHYAANIDGQDIVTSLSLEFFDNNLVVDQLRDMWHEKGSPLLTKTLPDNITINQFAVIFNNKYTVPKETILKLAEEILGGS